MSGFNKMTSKPFTNPTNESLCDSALVELPASYALAGQSLDLHGTSGKDHSIHVNNLGHREHLELVWPGEDVNKPGSTQKT